MGSHSREQKLGTGHKVASPEWHKSLLADPTLPLSQLGWDPQAQGWGGTGFGKREGSQEYPSSPGVAGSRTRALLSSGCDSARRSPHLPSLIPAKAASEVISLF